MKTTLRRGAGLRAMASAIAIATILTSVSATGAAGQMAPPPVQAVVMKGKAPVSNTVLDVKLPKPTQADLSNGLHLIVLEDHRAAQVSFTLYIPGAGGYFDPPGNVGVASVTAAMMREGTPTRTTTQIAEQLETMAAGLNIGADLSSLDAIVSGSALTDKFDKVMDLTADVLLHPTFPEAELTRYKTRQAAQLAQLRSIAGFLNQELYSKVMNGDHPAGRISMTPDDVKRINRDALVAFYQAHYVPDHAVIAFAGDISPDQARAMVESKLGAWKKAGTPKAVAKDPTPPSAAKVWLVDRANSVQSSFIVAAPAIDRLSPDYDAMQVMNAVVGGGPTGRLFTHLREEKGYTYGAYSGVNAGRYRGTWVASTDVRSDVTEPALTDLMDEIRQIRDIPVSDKELADKKRSLIAGFALSLESPQQVLSYYVTQWMYGLPADYWDRYPARVMAVSAGQVQTVAKKYLDPSKLQIFTVGDGKKIEDILRKFGPLEVYDTEGNRKAGIVP